jgi:hypothetical protein
MPLFLYLFQLSQSTNSKIGFLSCLRIPTKHKGCKKVADQMCWYCCTKRRKRDPFAVTSFPKFVPRSPALYNRRYIDVSTRSMGHSSLSVSPTNLDGSVLEDLDIQSLSVHVSVLDHLQVRSGLVVDAQPFLDSLRRAYHEQLARSISDAITVFHCQCYRLEAAWAPEDATLDGNSSATTGSLEVLCPQCLDFRLAFAIGALLSPMYRCGRMVEKNEKSFFFTSASPGSIKTLNRLCSNNSVFQVERGVSDTLIDY